MMKAKQTQDAEKITERIPGQRDYKEEDAALQMCNCLEASES